MATSPLHSRVRNAGQRPKRPHNPCLRGARRAGRTKLTYTTKKNGHIAPAFSGLQRGKENVCRCTILRRRIHTTQKKKGRRLQL